jgi:hypothetical protein
MMDGLPRLIAGWQYFAAMQLACERKFSDI